MLTYLLFRFFLTVPGAVTGADVAAAPAVAEVQKQAAETRDGTVAVDAPRVAQVRLAESLANADAIHTVRAKSGKVTFTITQGGQELALVATTRRGEITALSIGPASASAELGGGLSWLADEMQSITAITKLTADEDGAVTLTTDDGRRYMLIPGRGSGGSGGAASGGNEASKSRFAGEFDHT